MMVISASILRSTLTVRKKAYRTRLFCFFALPDARDGSISGVKFMFSSYGLQHIFILRLLKNYCFPSISSLQNLVFLTSAANLEPQELGFYDFVRTRTGAFSPYSQEILDDLQRAGLISTGCQVTSKGRVFCSYHGISLAPFLPFWKLCTDIVNCYHGRLDNLKKVVFHHVSFRRVHLYEEIFKTKQICQKI